jgi:hypothetical protein
MIVAFTEYAFGSVTDREEIAGPVDFAIDCCTLS